MIGNPSRILRLDALRLHTLPPLPPTVQTLMVSDNYLTSLPNLPSTLTWLDATANCLLTLPDPMPPHLESLYVSFNKIQTIPDMPSSLKLLSADHNPILQIGELPGIVILKLTDNALKYLPELPASALYVNHHCMRR